MTNYKLKYLKWQVINLIIILLSYLKTEENNFTHLFVVGKNVFFSIYSYSYILLDVIYYIFLFQFQSS